MRVLCLAGDGHDELHAALGGLHDRVLHARGGDEDARGGRAGGLDGLGDVGVDGDPVDVGAGLLGVRAGHDLRAVVTVEQAVELALRAGEALVADLGGLVDADGHGSVFSYFRARAASGHAAYTIVDAI